MAKKKIIDEDLDYTDPYEDEDNAEKEDFETIDDAPLSEKVKKAKKTKRERLVFTHDDDLKGLITNPEEDEEEKAYQAELKRIAALPPYDRFMLVLEDKLARIEDGDIAEVTAFDRNMEPLLKNDSTICLLRQISYLRIGDVVFHVNKFGKYSIRRIIKLEDEVEEVFLLGDNENRYTIVNRSDILAKVVAKIDGKKYTSFNTMTSKRKLTNGRVATAKLRTLGRVVEASEEDMAYVKATEEAKALEEANRKAAAKAKLVQSDKLENIDEAMKNTFSTTIDDKSGLNDDNKIVIGETKPKEENVPIEGFQTDVSNDLPGAISFGDISNATSEPLSDDQNYNTTGFQTSVSANDSIFEDTKSASFANNKTPAAMEELIPDKKKKKEKKGKKTAYDELMENAKPNVGSQTSSNDPFAISSTPDFGQSGDQAPSFNKTSDDDLPPIDFNK